MKRTRPDRSPQEIMGLRQIKSSGWRVAMNVCSCAECCRLQPWRRKVRREHKAMLKRSYAMLHGVRG